MNRLSCFLLALAIAGMNVVKAATPVVLVEHQGKYQGYFEKPRLGLVVTQLNTSASLYWPAARLFKVDLDTKLKLEQQRKQLLSRLAELKLEFQQDKELQFAASVEKLQKDISAWELAGAVYLSLDPDAVRSKKSLNPLLSEGQYKLQVTGRPTTVQLEGLVAEQSIAIADAVSVEHYLDSVNVLAGGSSSYLYIIPASGKFLIAKTGIWNKTYQEVSPGSLLFVPFEQRILPEAYSDINEQIVELLLHKVVAQ